MACRRHRSFRDPGRESRLPSLSTLPHLDEAGRARIVDVSDKPPTRRTARASGALRMAPATLDAIMEGALAKGDALAVARVAGIMAAKRTPEIVPLCHPLPLDHAAVELTPDPELPGIRVSVEVVTVARTGVEMEALTAAAASLLALYDMAKALDRGMTIETVRLESKSGGRSGIYVREEKA